MLYLYCVNYVISILCCININSYGVSKEKIEKNTINRFLNLSKESIWFQTSKLNPLHLKQYTTPDTCHFSDFVAPEVSAQPLIPYKATDE